ncbi:hypothetical protein GGS21DRAFT_509771 [Xylaria nigripes]|nr:hypothetical protein GGS21DRAFT_509771 [Xylaria nigripes]
MRNMSNSLKDKQAFFEQLEACANCDEEEDALDTKEQALRQRSRAFFPPAVQASPLLPAKPKPPGQSLRRTASDPSPKLANGISEVLIATPNHGDAKRTAFSVVDGNTIIPETEKHAKMRLERQGTRPPPALAPRSQSDLLPSPSVSMTKRKRSKPLQMKPDSEKIFTGLHFYYMPDNDINPARRSKITKAREHGVTWTRTPAEATHVIVDKGLTYADIKRFLDNSVMSSAVIYVNEDYPIECIRRNMVFDPKPTVEKHQYGIPGSPELPEEPTMAHTTRELTQESVMSATSSRARRAQPPKPTTENAGGAALATSLEPRNTDELPIFMDELMVCIDAVLDDPEKHEYLDRSDSDTEGPETEGPLKKRRKHGQSSMENGGHRSFDETKFMCMRAGTRNTKRTGPNADTIKLLEEMADEHSLWNETWRVHSYRKAIATLRRQPKKITTAKEAGALSNIGSSLADHIEEIVNTGHFQKLEQIRREPSRAALKTFYNIYGVGVATAMKWVEQGYRTLDDLRSKAKLSTNQKIGLEHYDDLLVRIPRAEVEALGDHVKDAAAAIDPDVEVIIGGSYRRGADSSGDIDLIVTKKGTSSSEDLVPLLDKLTDILTAQGFLTAALAPHRHEGGNKWHGCCVLPKVRFPGPKEEYRPTWRRIDFLLVPQTEIGAALIYFTGNDLFNRSIRLLARKKNMKLNHMALSGLGVHEGQDEKKIFEILGVKWREPHERWC